MPAKSYQFMTYNLKENTRDHGKIIQDGNIHQASLKNSLTGDRLRMEATCYVQMLQDAWREITTLMSDRCQVQYSYSDGKLPTIAGHDLT